MSKDQTPKADGLRAMREETRGHLQATVESSKIDRPIPIKSSAVAGYVEGAKPTTPLSKKLIPYAGADRLQGKSRRGGIPYSKNPKVKK